MKPTFFCSDDAMMDGDKTHLPIDPVSKLVSGLDHVAGAIEQAMGVTNAGKEPTSQLYIG